MKSGDWDQKLLEEHRGHLNAAGTQIAFDSLIKNALELPTYSCSPGWHGGIRDFRYIHRASGEHRFAFIVNRDSLLFYVRNPAQKSIPEVLSALKARFTKAAENPSGEWTIRIETAKHARAVSQILTESCLHDAFSVAKKSFDRGIEDAEELLAHCNRLGNPLPQEAEVFKRAGLVMALTAWETYVEDRIREGLESRSSNTRTYAEKFMQAKLEEDLRRFNNPNSENTRRLFSSYLELDVTKAWSWQHYDQERVIKELDEMTKKRGEAVHRSPSKIGGSPAPHLVTKDCLEKSIRFLCELVLATERAFSAPHRP